MYKFIIIIYLFTNQVSFGASSLEETKSQSLAHTGSQKHTEESDAGASIYNEASEGLLNKR